MSTKELIEQAKIDIKNVVRLSLGVVPLDDAFSSFLSRLKVFFSSPPPELDERHQVNLSKNEVVCLNNLLTIAKAQDNTGKVIERELQNTLMRLESVGC